MLINGKEVKFYFSIWAKTEWDNYILANKEKAISFAMMQLAFIMNEAAIRAGMGGEKLVPEDLEDLPARVYDQITEELKAQMDADSATTIETKEPAGKKTKNPR